MNGSVHGRVTAADGTPVADATVVIEDGPAPVPDVAALSDEAGRFVLDGLTAGTYRLRAVRTDGHTGHTPVSVAADGVAETSIVVDKIPDSQPPARPDRRRG